jgi:uncharacterized membrane protein YhaH (DUF805 family)
MALFNLLFGFAGRLRRRTFWLTVLAAILISMTYGAVDGFRNGAPEGKTIVPQSLGATIFSMFSIFVMVALYVKRLRDIDWPIWLAYVYGLYSVAYTVNAYLTVDPIQSALLKPLTPVITAWVASTVVTSIVFITIACIRGTAGPNQHGPDPLGVV